MEGAPNMTSVTPATECLLPENLIFRNAWQFSIILLLSMTYISLPADIKNMSDRSGKLYGLLELLQPQIRWVVCKAEYCVNKLIFLFICLVLNRMHCKTAEDQRGYKRWEWMEERGGPGCCGKKLGGGYRSWYILWWRFSSAIQSLIKLNLYNIVTLFVMLANFLSWCIFFFLKLISLFLYH